MIMRVVFDYDKIEGLLKDFKEMNRRIESNSIKINKEGSGEKRKALEKEIRLDYEKEKFIIGLLQGLTLRERMILHMFYVEGRRWSEVSGVLEIGESRIKIIRKKAIEQMVRMASI